MTKQVEKLAIIALILWLVSMIAGPLLMITVARCARPEAFGAMTTLDLMPLSIERIIACLVRAGVAVWLFKQAKRDKNSPWVWALFGLVFSITAVILYLLTELIQQLKNKGTDHT